MAENNTNNSTGNISTKELETWVFNILDTFNDTDNTIDMMVEYINDIGNYYNEDNNPEIKREFNMAANSIKNAQSKLSLIKKNFQDNMENFINKSNENTANTEADISKASSGFEGIEYD